MKSDSQSVSQRRQVDYAQRHPGQPNDGELLSALLENTEDSIYFKDLESRFLKISHALAKKLRLHHSDDAVGKSDSDFFAQTHAQKALEDELRIMRTGSALLSAEERETWPDGTETWVLTNKMALLDAKGKVIGSFGISHDITAKKAAENALRMAEEKYRRIFEDAIVGIFQARPDGRPISINGALAEILGYESPKQLLAEVSSLVQEVFVHPEQMVELRRVLEEQGSLRSAELELYRKDRSKRSVIANMRAVRDSGGNLAFIEGTIEDITDRKRAEERVQYLAYYDALTGLPNRTLLRDRVEKALAGARRRDERVAVLFVDLDQFKTINDTWGHSFGDQLLQEVAERLKRWAREQDTVARMGGDEFVLALTGLRDIPDAAVAAERLMDAMTTEFVVQGRGFNLSCSIGISICPDHGANSETLVRNADAAMYCAKESGRNAFRFFTEEMNAQVTERLDIERTLRQALENNELFLMYQPQTDLATGKIIGMEALLRWRHPRMGLVPPDKFIRVAENTGLILPIGKWVLKEACLEARRWQDQGFGVPVAVNVSAVQFRQEGFRDVVRTALREAGLAPHLLELELTESLLLATGDLTFPMLQELKAMGVKLAIDDFGTGYSSLSYLRQFPVNKLKIDRSFIKAVALNADDAAITSAIISMGRSLNLKVIAEGVENEGQISFLRTHQCDEMQGYYFSKPLLANEVADKLRSDSSRALSAARGSV